jgi:hypothetical protein
MLCYECSKLGKDRAAVGLCHHCSAGLCSDHACIVEDPVTTTVLMLRTVALPRKARVFLCGTCVQALGQIRGETMASETSHQCCAPAMSSASE